MKKTFTRDALSTTLAIISVLMAWVIFNWQALVSLHARWLHFDEAYAVGYPAVLLSLWWAIRHRQDITNKCRTTSSVALVLLAGILLLGMAARLVQFQLLQQLIALASLWLIIATLLGWSAGRMLLFPLAVLLPAVPLWDFLIDPLRALTVLFSQHMLNWLAIPAHVDGFRITLPSGSIEVAGGCSGLNLFLAMLLVGLMFAESHYLALERRVLIVVVAAITGIIDNWVRVFLLVVIAHRTEMQSQLVYHHGNFGWWIFVITLVPYFWFATRIERGGERIARKPRAHFTSRPSVSSPRIIGVSALLVALMLTAWWGVCRVENRRGLAVQGFIAPAMTVSSAATWLPKYSGQDLTQTWHLQGGARAYEIVALMFLEQTANKKLIYFNNRIADESEIVDIGRVAVTPDFNVNTAVINDHNKRYVWWFWWVDGNTSVSVLETKLLQLRASLFGDPSAALVVLSSTCNSAICPTHPPDIDDELRQVLVGLRQLRAVNN